MHSINAVSPLDASMLLSTQRALRTIFPEDEYNNYIHNALLEPKKIYQLPQTPGAKVISIVPHPTEKDVVLKFYTDLEYLIAQQILDRLSLLAGVKNDRGGDKVIMHMQGNPAYWQIALSEKNRLEMAIYCGFVTLRNQQLQAASVKEQGEEQDGTPLFSDPFRPILALDDQMLLSMREALGKIFKEVVYLPYINHASLAATIIQKPEKTAQGIITQPGLHSTQKDVVLKFFTQEDYSIAEQILDRLNLAGVKNARGERKVIMQFAQPQDQSIPAFWQISLSEKNRKEIEKYCNTLPVFFTGKNQLLKLASVEGNWEQVSALLTGAVPQAQIREVIDENERSVLYDWILNGIDVGTFSRLTDLIPANCRDLFTQYDTKKKTLLHVAAQANNPAVMQLLISDYGLSLDSTNQFNETCLYPAIQANSEDCINFILSFNKVSLSSLNRYGDSPIHYALKKSQCEIALRLLEHFFKTVLKVPSVLLYQLVEIYSDLFKSILSSVESESDLSLHSSEGEEHLGESASIPLPPPCPLGVPKLSAATVVLKEEQSSSSCVAASAARSDFEAIRMERERQWEVLKDLLKSSDSADPNLCFILLAHSDFFLLQEKYPDAMLFATAALNHYEKFGKTFFNNSELSNSLTNQLQRILLVYRQKQCNVDNKYKGFDFSFRPKRLAEHRAMLKSSLEVPSVKISELLVINTYFFNRITAHLFEEAKLCCKVRSAPCNYVILGLDLMARKEMCPYSDLKFMLIVDREPTLEIRTYFNQLIGLMELLVISLGETPLVLQCRDGVQFLPQGYHFNPNHTPKNPHFIGTLEHFERKQKHEPLFRYVSYIAGFEPGVEPGKEKLLLQYQETLAYQKRRSMSFRDSLEEKKQFGILFSQYQDIYQRFCIPALVLERAHVSNRINLEKDLYYLLSQLTDCLSLYYGITVPGFYQQIEMLSLEHS